MNRQAHMFSLHQRNNFKSNSDLLPSSFQERFFAGKFDRSSHSNNEEYWCDTCDRSFKTRQILENHKQQHQKCNIDGCQFVAHPKVITKHIQMQHSTGIFKKIAKLNDPEEVQKWLEERKKKYPTQKNIEKKAAEIREKIERGEKMGLKRQHRGYKSEGQNKKLMHDKNKHFKDKRKPNVNNNKQPINLYRIPSPISNRKLKPFSGILDLIVEPTVDDEEEIHHSNFLIDDDDYTELENVPLKSEEPKICGVLSSLICNYGSSDEEDSNTDLCNKTVSTESVNLNTGKSDKLLNSNSNFILENHTNTILENGFHDNREIVPEKHINGQSDEDSGPEEQKITKTDVNENNNQKQTLNVSNKLKQSNENTVKVKSEKILKKVDRPVFRKPKPKKPPSTLLRKLLWREMRQERNMVLQCIRYIVKNKYFDLNNT